MPLVTVVAPSLPEAMAEVRARLGASAVVVSWRQGPRGIELTASGKDEDRGMGGAGQPAASASRPLADADGSEYQAWNSVVSARAGRPRAPRHDVFAGEPKAPERAAVRPARAPAARSDAPDLPRPPKARTDSPAQAARPGGAAAKAAAAPAQRRRGPSPRALDMMRLGLPALSWKHWQKLDGSEPLAQLLPAELARQLTFAIGIDRPTLPVVLAGPPGAGKTAGVAKLAARALDAGASVCVISADTERSGGTGQLEAFARRLGARFETAASLVMAGRLARQGMGRGDVVLLDAPAASHLIPADIRLAGNLAAETGGSLMVCLPADARADDLADAASAWQEAGATGAALTRLDLTARPMGAIDALARAGLALTWVGATAYIGGGLVPADPRHLARLVSDCLPDKRRAA